MLGLGESGEAAARLLVEENAMVTILDSADLKKIRSKIERITPLGVAILAGAEAGSHVPDYDLAVLSPGIDPASPLVQNFLRKRIDMIGELEFAFELCVCPVVAITGTNGKTTTTQLVEQMLNACGVKTVAAGNIGPAFSSVVKQSPQLDLMTLEVSSFQLEAVRSFRPHIAVWLNFAADHLDRYATMDDYRHAKLRIFENQTAEDFAVVNLRDLRAGTLDRRGREPRRIATRARLVTFSAYVPGADFDFRDGAIFYRGQKVLAMRDTNLRGLHNAENLMAALGVGVAHGLDFNRMRPPLCAYKPLPHRCELVRTIDSVAYVNDSKATNLDALEKALLSETCPVVLIAGGKDKGFEFDSIAELVAQKAHHVVLIGEMAGRIERMWGARVPCVQAGSLSGAIALARQRSRPGDVVLFSPGTSSFDMFQNYEDRGDQFRAIVQAMTEK